MSHEMSVSERGRCDSCNGKEDVRVLEVKNDDTGREVKMRLCYQCRGDIIGMLKDGVYGECSYKRIVKEEGVVIEPNSGSFIIGERKLNDLLDRRFFNCKEGGSDE